MINCDAHRCRLLPPTAERIAREHSASTSWPNTADVGRLTSVDSVVTCDGRWEPWIMLE